MTTTDLEKKLKEIAGWFEQQEYDYYAPYVFEWVEKAIVFFPDMPELYYWWGRAFQSLGEKQLAKGNWQKAIELNPCYTEAYLCLVGIILDEGTAEEYEAATKLCETALHYNPYSVEAWIELISYHRGEQQRDKAIQLCEEMLEKNPDSAKAHWYAAMVFSDKYPNPFERAFEHYNKAIALDPDNYEYYYYRYFLWGRVGCWEEALADLEKAKTCKGCCVLYHYTILTKIRLGRYSDALAEANSELQKDKREALYALRSNIYTAMGDYKSALADVGTAISKTPKYETAQKGHYYGQRAAIYLQALQPNKALADLNKALEYTKYYANRAYYLIRQAIIYADVLTNIEKATELATEALALFAIENTPQIDKLLDKESLDFLKKMKVLK